jgi:hypothetical protein
MRHQIFGHLLVVGDLFYHESYFSLWISEGYVKASILLYHKRVTVRRFVFISIIPDEIKMGICWIVEGTGNVQIVRGPLVCRDFGDRLRLYGANGHCERGGEDQFHIDTFVTFGTSPYLGGRMKGVRSSEPYGLCYVPN